MVSQKVDTSSDIPNGTIENGTSSLQKKEERKTVSLSSSLRVEIYTHTWKVKGFNEIPFIAKYPIQSPNFILGKENGSLFQVVMSKHSFDPDRDSEDSEDDSECDSDIDSESSKCVHEKERANAKAAERKQSERVKRLGLRLVKLDDDTVWDVLNYTFTLKTADGFSVKTSPREEPGDSEFETKPKFLFLTEKDFGDRNLFNEKNLDIVCDITYKYLKNHPLYTPVSSEESQFAEDLKLLFLDKKFCNVVLEVNGSEIHAHKSILCARALEFENLLEEDKSATKQTFDLKMEAEVGKAFIHFLYCGEIPDHFPVEKCVDLYKAAESYEVFNLKQKCSEYFKKNLHSGICKTDLGLGSSDLDLETVVKLDSAKTKQIFSKEKCPHVTEVKL